MNRLPTAFLLSISLILSVSCSTEPDFEGRAIILNAGGLDGEMFKEQKIAIAYKYNKDSVAYAELELPEFGKAALPGDSIEITVKGEDISFGKLYKYPNRPDHRYYYTTVGYPVRKILLFDFNMICLINYDLSNETGEFQYFQLSSIQNPGEVYVSPIGFAEELIFSMEGTLGADSLTLPMYEEVFFLK